MYVEGSFNPKAYLNPSRTGVWGLPLVWNRRGHRGYVHTQSSRNLAFSVEWAVGFPRTQELDDVCFRFQVPDTIL